MSDRAYTIFLAISLISVLIMAAALFAYGYLDHKHNVEMRTRYPKQF
jgi:hypothetical protein